jgi:hypothetical protein
MKVYIFLLASTSFLCIYPQMTPVISHAQDPQDPQDPKDQPEDLQVHEVGKNN